MKLYKITEVDSDIMKKVADRVGPGEFRYKDVSDIIPCHHFLRRMNNASHIIRGKQLPGLTTRQWQIADHTYQVLTGGGSR